MEAPGQLPSLPSPKSGAGHQCPRTPHGMAASQTSPQATTVEEQEITRFPPNRLASKDRGAYWGARFHVTESDIIAPEICNTILVKALYNTVHVLTARMNE